MRLDIKHWEMLKAISETGTLRQAAFNLGVTQSALSHRLAEAERRLGGPLFEREGRRLRETPAGRSMTQIANQIVPALARAELDFQQVADTSVSVVRFGVAAYNCYHWLPAFLEEMSKNEPSIQLELVASATQNPLRNLQEGAVDVVLAPGHLVIPGIESLSVFKDELVFVSPISHELAHKKYIEASDLESEVYLTYSNTAQPGFEYERFIRPSGVVPHLVTVVEVTDAIIELVSAGFGVSILSKWAIQSAINSNSISTASLGKASLNFDWSALVRSAEVNNSPARVLSRRLAQWFQMHEIED